MSNTLNCVLIFEGLAMKVRIPHPRDWEPWIMGQIRAAGIREGGGGGDGCE